MYLPKPYESFAKQFPEILTQYQTLSKTCREIGPLDTKSQNLVKLGIAMGANSRGGVMSAVRKSLAEGTSAEEIRHAVLLSITSTGFPNMIAAMGWVEEVLAKQ